MTDKRIRSFYYCYSTCSGILNFVCGKTTQTGHKRWWSSQSLNSVMNCSLGTNGEWTIFSPGSKMPDTQGTPPALVAGMPVGGGVSPQPAFMYRGVWIPMVITISTGQTRSVLWVHVLCLCVCVCMHVCVCVCLTVCVSMHAWVLVCECNVGLALWSSVAWIACILVVVSLRLWCLLHTEHHSLTV